MRGTSLRVGTTAIVASFAVLSLVGCKSGGDRRREGAAGPVSVRRRDPGKSQATHPVRRRQDVRRGSHPVAPLQQDGTAAETTEASGGLLYFVVRDRAAPEEGGGLVEVRRHEVGEREQVGPQGFRLSLYG